MSGGRDMSNYSIGKTQQQQGSANHSQGLPSPKTLMRQQGVDVSPEMDTDDMIGPDHHHLAPKSKPATRWYPRLSNKRHSSVEHNNRPNQNNSKTSWTRLLSQKMSRLSSLDSTKSGSSLEADTSTSTELQLRSQSSGLSQMSVNQQHQQQVSTRLLNSVGNTSNRMVFNFNQFDSFGGQIDEEEQDNMNMINDRTPTQGNRSDSASKRQSFRRKANRMNSASFMNHDDGRNHDEDYDERRDRDDDDDDDDDDAFHDAPLPIPYSCSRFAHSDRHGDAHLASYYEDLLDDRQGMNNSEHEQFTKGEQQGWPSIDGSIASGLRLPPMDGMRKDSALTRNSNLNGLATKPEDHASGAASSASKGTNKTTVDTKRSKSPSSTTSSPGGPQRGLRQRPGSRRGLFGLASKLKLTKKHDSIESLQLSILNSGFISLKTLDRDLQSFLPKERMTPKEFDMRVKLMRKFPVLAKIEYKFASRYETYVCRQALHEANLIKNNYKKCIPYDYNRVVLRTIPGKLHSDYVNASHVDSILKPNAYIAAQGPNDNTIEDFWRMVWEQKTFVIVMLTKVFDFIRVMCNQYWPVELNKPECYGNLEVTLIYEEPLADFVIRTIKLVKKANNNKNNTNTNDNNTNSDPNSNNSTSKNQDAPNWKSRHHQDQADETNREGDVSDNSELSDSSLGAVSGGFSFTGANTAGDNPNIVVINDDSDIIDTENNNNTRMQNSKPKVRAPRFVVAPASANYLDPNQRPTSAPPRAQEDKPRTILERRASRNREDPMSSSMSCKDLNLDDPQFGSSNQLNANNSLFLQCPSPSVSLSLSQLQLNTTSMSSMLSAPQTPASPTPSTGLDRSSATRKPVKKKRRIRVKNARPMKTQFKVPDESQLLDDCDDDPMQGTGSGAGTGNVNGASNERIVYQFHYNSWASHTCPFISSLLHFRRRVRICMDEMSKSGKTGPTIVHCNDGCGRTGAYLCIDANLELVEEDNVYDVYNYTKKLRQSRKFLIENLEQYKFVYDTIEEALFCGKTWFPVSELHKRLKHKSQRNPVTKRNEYLVEYEKITRMTSKFSIGDCAGGHRVENREKNRDVSTVPPDNFRPYLSSFQTNDSTDYINAVFVDGYTRSKEYIVTEWPLLKTISDFWSLVYDHDCNSVILLANPSESTTYPSFLPSEKELRRKFGPVFSAEMVSYTHYQNIKSWIYTINKKIVSLTEVIAGVKSEAKTTQVFQITCWPQGHRVPTSTNALVELMNMVERWRQRTAYGPVCVVSLDGKSRAGVYCAANVAIEQVVQHGEVDVFQAVKTVRRHRPQLIENMTEYKYCYDLILHYVLHYLNQPNAAS